MRIDIARAAELLRENDDILVLCHAHPDGDTLGCGYAQCICCSRSANAADSNVRMK